jgi:hypothetical protein
MSRYLPAADLSWHRQREAIRRSTYLHFVRSRVPAYGLVVMVFLAAADSLSDLSPRAVNWLAEFLTPTFQLHEHPKLRELVVRSSWVLAGMMVLLSADVHDVVIKAAVVPRPGRIVLGRSFRVAMLCGLLVQSVGARDILPRSWRRGVHASIDYNVRQLGGAIMAIPRDKTISAVAARRGELKQHTALVAAALERAAREFDKDPDRAARELCAMTALILDRYLDCRFGALLDEDQLTGLEPVRNRETLRLILAATLTAAAAVGIGFLNPPAAAVPLLIGVAGLLFFSLAYGHRTGRSLDYLDALRGVQRP